VALFAAAVTGQGSVALGDVNSDNGLVPVLH